ncbi:nitrate/nitrite transporter NrtS [Neiella marina]|uniref:Nitrate/nitrite transporter NrtS n=1 Tax=Neiella holothuriorum TaxID=2870530 RepID=A0ABS7ELM7_9GAMM|nr:nitrate/nitrite transporter NrtS [Neiella holothuriorum]MBW8192521.1 nitrate/nitrite transporter NrtS [Neiella holothuriorum]
MTRLILTALRPSIVTTSVRIALVVGSLLVLINHGPSLLSGHVYLGQLWQIGLTYLVPYLVASYSAAKTVLAMDDRQRSARHR